MAVTSLGEFASSGPVAALSGSPNAAVPVGAVLVVGITTSSTSSAFTVTDTQGNTYTQIATANPASSIQTVPYLCTTTTALSTSDTITVDPSGSAGIAFFVDRVTGVSGALDGTAKTASNTAGGSTTPATAAMTVAAGSTVYMVVCTGLSRTFTPGGSFTSDHSFASSGAGTIRGNQAEVLVGASAGSLTPSMTLSSSSTWSAVAFSLVSSVATSASGTAALALSASGTALSGIHVAGTSSLQLSGQVDTGASPTSTGSLSLVASATSQARIAGTASISLLAKAPAGASGPFVEADFSGTPFGGSPTWTDITKYVLDPMSDRGAELTGSWGRQDWFSQSSPSSMSLVLNNADGRFTPGLTSSPYYPYVKYGTRIRYREVIGSTFVFVFDGYITDITTTPVNGSYWTTSVDATDIISRFANTLPLRSLLAEEMLLDNPSCLYAMQEPEGAVTFADISGGHAVAVTADSNAGAGVIQAGQSPDGNFIAGSLVGVTNDSYLTWDGSTGANAQGSAVALPFVPGGASWTFEIWVQMPVATAPVGIAATIAGFGEPVGPPPIPAGFHLLSSATGGVSATYSDGTRSATAAAASTYLDGAVHQFAVTVGSNQRTVSLYADGALVGSASASAPITAPSGVVYTLLGMSSSASAPQSQFPFSAAYAYGAYYPTALSASRILAHYNAGANGFTGENTSTHVSRLLSYRPNLGSILDSGTAAVGPADTAGQTVQDALLDVAQTEAGTIFADGQARVNFRGRSRQIHPSTALTLDASLGQVNVESTFREDIQGVVNDYTVSRSGGADQRYTDTAHAATYGYYSQSTSVNIDSDANALALAQFYVGLGTLDQLSVPTLTVDLYQLLAKGYNTLVAQILQLRPMDVVQLTNLPSPSPASTMKVAIQGGSFARSAGSFTVSFNALPCPP